MEYVKAHARRNNREQAAETCIAQQNNTVIGKEYWVTFNEGASVDLLGVSV